MASDRLNRLLDQLDLRSGDIVFLHTSYSRIGTFVASPMELIDGLAERIGPAGTLAMPRYTWHLLPEARPWRGYAEYLQRLPALDLRSTPANIGVVPEMFRSMPGAKISISHFWPVAARGAAAEGLLEGQAAIDHAYGPGSVFARLVEARAKIVGLGVTLNTTSVAPVADVHLAPGHQAAVFTAEPVPGTVYGLDGACHRTRTVTMRAEAVRDIKPSRILVDRLRPGSDFPYVVHEGNFFFSYPADLYHEVAIAEGKLALRQGRAPPWLS